MMPEETPNGTMAQIYDREAEATGWLGPEVVFGLAYEYLEPGQSILDIGIGTGLGSNLYSKAGLRVHGMDLSQQMLEVCRAKGFVTDLKRHDLTSIPYPYETASLDHVVSVGVLHFFPNLSLVFSEVARIVQNEGLFAFVVGDRDPEEEAGISVGREHTGTGTQVTIYRHTSFEVTDMLRESDFKPLKSIEFAAYMDHEKTKKLRARAYLTKRNPR
jgi:predicted TPR repeat methyltransferase